MIKRGRQTLTFSVSRQMFERDDHPVLFDFQGAVGFIIGTQLPQRQTVGKAVFWKNSAPPGFENGKRKRAIFWSPLVLLHF